MNSEIGACRKWNIRTYADCNWMVVLEVVSYMMIVQRLHRFASAHVWNDDEHTADES